MVESKKSRIMTVNISYIIIKNLLYAKLYTKNAKVVIFALKSFTCSLIGETYINM